MDETVQSIAVGTAGGHGMDDRGGAPLSDADWSPDTGGAPRSAEEALSEHWRSQRGGIGRHPANGPERLAGEPGIEQPPSYPDPLAMYPDPLAMYPLPPAVPGNGGHSARRDYFTPVRQTPAPTGPTSEYQAPVEYLSPAEGLGGYDQIPSARTAPPPQYGEGPVYYAEAYRDEPADLYDEPRAYDEPRGYFEEPSRHLEPHQPEPRQPEALPQRVPGVPDVPSVPPEISPEPVVEGPPAQAPELARIATYLRDDDEEADPVRPDGFDVQAVLEAARAVPGVRFAQLRAGAGGAHTLRLELADDADPGLVSRQVARILKERMGLAAEPNDTDDDDLLGGALIAEALTGEPVPAAGWGDGYPPTLAPAPVSAVPGGLVPMPQNRTVAPRPRRGPEPHSEAGVAAPARPVFGGAMGSRVVVEQVDVVTHGTEAVVEVRLSADGVPALGVASGPAFDGYVLRLAANAAASAIDEMLVEADGTTRGRCFVEHVSLVPLGSCEVAVVVLLLACGGWVEQLAGSAVVAHDQRQAMVHATLAAVNRRLEALLP